MLMTEETRTKLNDVLTHSFLLNMICDNLVYEIDFNVYPKTSEIVHEAFAHYWPVVADEWSNLAIKLNAKPVRGNLVFEYTDHEGDLSKIFEEIAKETENYRKEIIDLIDVADLNGDAEVKIKAEEILVSIMPYRKQADIWAEEAKRYVGNYKSFDARFAGFTTMIPISND